MNLNTPLFSNADADQNAERIDLQNHTGELWNCIGKREAPYGGYIYRFIAKEEFDNYSPSLALKQHFMDVDQKKLEIYPAIEATILELATYSKKNLDDLRLFFDSPGSRQTQANAAALNEVGYQFLVGENNVEIELPDLQALQKGWKHFQDAHPEMDLRNLDIIDSEGIADDITYANAYRDHDGLLSSGKEFIHDHTVHLMGRITSMLKGKASYEAEKKHLLRLIGHVRMVIQEAEKRDAPHGVIHTEKEKLNFIIGMLTDILFSGGNKGPLNQEIIERWLSKPRLFDGWNNYLEKRFGPGIKADMISELWAEVRRLVPLNERVRY